METLTVPIRRRSILLSVAVIAPLLPRYVQRRDKFHNASARSACSSSSVSTLQICSLFFFSLSPKECINSFNAFVIYLYVYMLFNCMIVFYTFFFLFFLVLKLKLLVVCGFETRPYCLPFCDLLGASELSFRGICGV